MDLQKRIEQLIEGTHIASIYRDKEEQLSLVIPFMVSALKKNRKCLYILDESTRGEISQAAKKVGLSIEKCASWGQFNFFSKEETYLQDGYFTPGRMLEMVVRAETRALHEGFSGLNSTGEMSWVFAGFPGSDKFIEYESKFNYLYPESKSLTICQYNEDRFSADALRDVIYTHPYVFIRGRLLENPFYEPPDVFFERKDKRPMAHTYGHIRDTILKNAPPE